ncbi:MAG: hypothetical protein H0U71_07305 [Gammaproteobacteria bacterium]|nr:hypothetical protein [Gammaproteobacteria bacterium]
MEYGIAEEPLSYIFDCFYQADKSRTRNINGIRLDLTIVKSIVDLHQGCISITSEANEGTIVIINLPK